MIGPIEFMDDVEGTPVMLTKLQTMINSIDKSKISKFFLDANCQMLTSYKNGNCSIINGVSSPWIT